MSQHVGDRCDGNDGKFPTPKSSVTAVTAVTFIMELERQQRACVGVPLRVMDAPGPHELRVLGEVLAERRRRHPGDPHLFHERVRGTFPMTEIGDEPDDR